MLSHLENQQEVSYLVTETAIDLLTQEALAISRLEYTKRAVTASFSQISAEDGSVLRDFMLSPETEKYFVGVDFSPYDSSIHEKVAATVVEHMNGVLSFVSSMALVFAHSYLEELLMKCFHILTLHQPDLWMDRLGKKKVELSEIDAKGLSGLAEEKLNEHLDDLSKESIIRKIGVLETMTATSHKPSPLKDYEYSADEIKRLDDLRHDFAHRRKLSYHVEDAKSDVRYLFQTGLHFFTLVVIRFKLQGAYRPKANGQE